MAFAGAYTCGVRVLAARLLRAQEYSAFWGLPPNDNADPGLDENGRSQGDHLVRNVSAHSLP
jgi:hypothetical protein